MNYYDVLEVSRTASPDVIEAAWKALQKKYHPDGATPDPVRSVAINVAHDVLKHPESRRGYDRTLDRDPEIAGQLKPRVDWAQVFGGAYPAAYSGNVEETLISIAEQAAASAFATAFGSLPPELRQALDQMAKMAKRKPK